MTRKIVVIGSSNTDLVIRTSKFPKPGETVIGDDFNVFAGGKGANQAVAASKLGGKVTFVAKVGEDSFGKSAIDGFIKAGIETDFVYVDKDLPSGVASITLNDKGQNSIIVAPGANNSLSSNDIEQALGRLKEADLVLLQLEVPLETVYYSIRQSHQYGKRLILNPAPANKLPKEIYPLIDVITPNETEAKILTGIPVLNRASAAQAASKFLEWGVGNVVITMGEKGVFFKNTEKEYFFAAEKTKVVDTTGAGDIFNGALAIALAEGKDWPTTLRFANIAASIGVSRMGAQASVPSRIEIDSLL